MDLEVRAGELPLRARGESGSRRLRARPQEPAAAEEVPRDCVSVQAATLGFVRDFPWLSEMETGLGADFTFYRFPSRFDSVYGSHPISFHGFLRIRFGSHAGMRHRASQLAGIVHLHQGVVRGSS